MTERLHSQLEKTKREEEKVESTVLELLGEL